MYKFKTFISSVFTLSVANATVSVDTMEFGQPIKNHHFNMFALSFATATVSADTILFAHKLKTIIFFVFTLSIASATVNVITITFCAFINNYYFQCVYSNRCYCNS